MKNKNTFSLLCFIFCLTACEKPNEPSNHPSTNAIETVNISKDQTQNKQLDKTIDCSNSTLDQWYGFDESKLENAKCLELKSYDLKQKKCEMSPNAFGADFDALLIQKTEQKIFAYSSIQKCEAAKEIWESSAP